MQLVGIGLLAFAGFVWVSAPTNGEISRAFFGSGAQRTGMSGSERGSRGPIPILISVAAAVTGVVAIVGAIVQG